MDGLFTALLIIGIVEILAMLAANIIIFRFRSVIFIRSGVPFLIIAQNVAYQVSVATSLLNAAGSTNCILYHYDGFLNVILLAAAYMAMIFHMIARLAVERRRYSESTALEDSGNSSSESIVENKPTLPQHRWSFFENWLIRWKDSARPQTALKVYLLLIAVLLLIPILLHIIDDKYHDLTSQCDERTTIEIAGLILLFILILGSFCYGLIKIRSFQTPYGEKQRLVGLIVAWVLILIILPAVGFVDSPWVKIVYKILSVTIFIVLFLLGNAGLIARLIRRKDIQSLIVTNGASKETSDDASSDAAKKKISFKDVLLYNYGDKLDYLSSFANHFDMFRDERGSYAYTICFLRNWNAILEKKLDEFRMSTEALRQYGRYVQLGALYPIIMPTDPGQRETYRESIREAMEKFSQAHSQEDSASTFICHPAIQQLYDECMLYLEGEFFQGYIQSEFYRKFVKDLTNAQIMLSASPSV